MKYIIFLSVIFSLLCNNALAEQVRPPKGSDTITVPATIEKDPIRQISIGKFIAKFEETTLSDIQKVIGKGTIDHSGDASESIYWLCYSLPKQRIWFISDGEMGSPNHALTQIVAMTFSFDIETSPYCPLLSVNSMPVSFDFGWLGTSKQQIIGALGQPSGTKDNTLSYFYSGTQSGDYKGKIENWDVIGYLEFILENDKVISIKASHVTSN